MRCWTFTSALALLAIGAVDAQDACDSNVLVDAYEGLNVNDQLVSCMTQNNFSAALDGSVDLTSVEAGSTQEQVTTICQSDACLTVISALVDSSNFNLTNCTVGDGIVLMDELNNLNAACDVIVAEGSSEGSASDEGSASVDSSYSTEGSSSQAATEGSSSASTSETVTTPAPETSTPETTTPETTTATPATETPATETPATETPATETPATETPATETPATETPATETPATETPATETPSTETPATSTPETTSPATSAPETTTTPETTAPSTDDVTQETTTSPSTDSFSILDSDSGSTAGVTTPSKYCSNLIGTKRAAEGEPSAATPPAPQVRKVGKKEARRLRKQMRYRVEVGLCAKDGDAARALELYERMKTEGVNVSPYMYHVVINVCSKAEDPAAFKGGAFKVYEDMKQRGSASKHMVEESTYSALIKLCSKDQDFEACTELLAAMEAETVAPKLRTFTPLLLAYSEVGNLDKCVWVHEKMVSHALEPTETDYVALLRVCVKTGNAERFYAFLDAFIEDIMQPGPSAWEVLKDWFSSEAAQVDGRKWTISEGTVSKDGVCSVTGDQLRSLELAPAVEKALLDKVEQLVRTDEKRIAQWDAFKQWLEASGPFDVVVDAANVGYFNQNFDGGGFSYEQIASMVEHYEAQSKKVLLLLHQRRTEDEQVPPEHRSLVAQWRARGVMYNCQTGNNDDWYWLYAAVKLGGRTLLVSNDEMRDHHFQMIHDRALARWKERHQVHYQVRGRRVEAEEPPPFSARPQRVGETWHFPSRDGGDGEEDVAPHAAAKSSGANSSPWLCVRQEAGPH
ncbi:hypothetical protein BBJ28_00016624 [Nothophytophthora sp. Chile5]|nr:hypothetical protein BBJ28_00016624 [Nothophytophthora sp. Chile5]